MTTKQKNFCSEYILSGGNSAAAARRAGYSTNGAKVTGCNLLKRPDVRSEIDSHLDDLQDEKIADEREILQLLTSIMRGEVEETVITPSGKKFVVPANCTSRLKAADMLLKVYGAYQREEESKADGGAILIETLTRLSAEIDDDAEK